MERPEFDADTKMKDAMRRRGQSMPVGQVALQPTVAMAERSAVVFGNEAQLPRGYAVAAAADKKATERTQ